MTDERVLFDRAAQPMRPEFRAHLDDLFDLLESQSAEQLVDNSGDPVVVEVSARPPRQRRRWHGLWWLAAGTAAASFAGVVVASRMQNDPAEVPATAVPESTTAPRATCPTGTSLGELTIGSAVVSVSAVDDGRFCLADGANDLPVGTEAVGALPTEPTLIDSGPIGETGGYFYVFAVPQSLPVNLVVNESAEPADVFVNSIGRRLLIIEADVDPDSAFVTRSWELRSDGDATVGTLSASGPLPRSMSTEETEATP